MRARHRGPAGSRVAAIAGSIVGTQLVTGALGVVYWTVAARGLPRTTVGQLGSATAAGALLGAFGTMGVGTLLVSRLRAVSARERRDLLLAGLAVSITGGTLLAALFGLAASAFVPAFGFLSPGHGAFWWLLGTAAAISAGAVFDQAMLVVGRPSAQVLRNAVASGVKVGVLAGAVAAGRHGVASGLAAWALGQLAANALALRAALRTMPAGGSVTAPGVRAAFAAHWREALGHHAMNIALAAPATLQPVIIAAVVSAESNAAYTTVRLISLLAFMAPYALAMALFTASAGDRDELRARSRSVFRVSLGLSLVLYAGLFVGAPVALRIFGSGYAAEGTHYLRVIGLALPLLVFKDQYIAQARAAGHSTAAMPYLLVATALELGATLAGGLGGGLGGALAGWLLALALGAAWVCLRWRHDGTAAAADLVPAVEGVRT